MKLLVLALIALGMFLCITFLRKWFDKFILIAFAIGCAVNANLFNSLTRPVEGLGLYFGIDAILYTIFLYAILVAYFKYGRDYAKDIALSSIVAIIISAFIEFFANGTAGGFTTGLLKSLSLYFISSIGSIVGIILMIIYVKKMEEMHVSKYISLPVAIIIGCIVNSTIYFLGYNVLYGNSITDFVKYLVGSYLGRLFSIAISILCFFINEKYWKVIEPKVE